MLSQIEPQHDAVIALWFVLQHSLSAYRKLLQHFGSAERALQFDALDQWQQLGLHAQHIERFKTFHQATGQQAWQHCQTLLRKHCDQIIAEDELSYPSQLLSFDDRPPILFVQGQAQVLLQPQIAVVGSRKPSPSGQQIAHDFAVYLSEQGFYISSGLAQGIDEAAHRGGLRHGRTIAVMATGLDLTYPAANQVLRDQIVQHNGAVITEFLPQTKPLQHHFPRRNRIVSGLSLGILVAEATLKSGSLITAKLAADQGKTVFAIPGHILSEHYKGCHALIRDGAILVDHPQQLVDELSLATAWQNQANARAETTAPLETLIPEQLCQLYQQLDWVGRSLDQLAQVFAGSTAELTSQLMQLELLGFCVQQGGLYLRCCNNNTYTSSTSEGALAQ